MSETSYVFDASALLCVIYQEPGADVVARHFDGAVISSVNYSEVVAKLQQRGASDEDIAAGLADININIAAFDTDSAIRAGKLRKATRHRGLSLGDRACLALAITQDAVAVTTDKAWASLDIGVKVQVVR